jgi:hypothetical protein
MARPRGMSASSPKPPWGGTLPRGLGEVAKHRIVVAEDDADFRAALAALLRADGRFEVVGEAENGREASTSCASSGRMRS